MASFDLIKQPNLSNGISAAEKRTKLSTQGPPQVCGCVQARTRPFLCTSSAAGGTYLMGAPGCRQRRSNHVHTRGALLDFLFSKSGKLGFHGALSDLHLPVFILFYGHMPFISFSKLVVGYDLRSIARGTHGTPFLGYAVLVVPRRRTECVPSCGLESCQRMAEEEAAHSSINAWKLRAARSSYTFSEVARDHL